MLVWRLDDRRGTLPVHAVERVLPAMAVQAVAAAPVKLMGIVRLQGRALPVVDLRRHLAEPARELRPSDRLVLLKNGPWRFGLFVDTVEDVLIANGPGAPPALDVDGLYSEDDQRRLAALGVQT
ncbi:chemotaxis protein CheW [Piscinibacter sp.]|uniref:chemotaxis protein CheW n=1 Tax=Piscinibacter sp. TaxID=1903157 RepID=UPI002ED401E8